MNEVRNDKSVLVTGAGGFIGRSLCKRLIEEGYQVRGLAMPKENTDAIEQMGVSIVRGDLSRPETIRGICDGIHTVYHLAARVTYWGSKKDFYDAILGATQHLLEESKGKIRRFIYASSAVATGFGPAHRKGLEETDPVYKTGIYYGDAKLDAEALVWEYHNAGHILGTVIRPTNAIGPAGVWVVDAIANLKKPFLPLIDGGKWSASLVYVDNLADAFFLAGTKAEAIGQTYHVQDDYKVTWRQYFSDIAELIGKQVTATTFLSMPFRLAWWTSGLVGTLCAWLRIKTTLTHHNVGMMGRDNDLDSSKIRKELGWTTNVSYTEAMSRIKDWIKASSIAN